VQNNRRRRGNPPMFTADMNVMYVVREKEKDTQRPCLSRSEGEDNFRIDEDDYRVMKRFIKYMEKKIGRKI